MRPPSLRRSARRRPHHVGNRTARPGRLATGYRHQRSHIIELAPASGEPSSFRASSSSSSRSCRRPPAPPNRPTPPSRSRLRQAPTASRIADLEGRHSRAATQHLGGDLSQDGVGAGADISRGAGDLERAVGGERRARAAPARCGLPDAGRHAPAHELRALAHRARLRIAPRPAEALGALVVAVPSALLLKGLPSFWSISA